MVYNTYRIRLKSIFKFFEKFILTLILALFSFPGFTQNSELEFLNQVWKNNKEIKALNELAISEQLYAKTGILPANPEIEYGYYPGNTDNIGVKESFSITQSFYFPTVYKTINSQAQVNAEIALNKVKWQQSNILLEALNTYFDWIYYSKLCVLFEEQFENAEFIRVATQRKFEIEAATIIELNKAKLQHLEAKSKLNTAKIQKKSLESKLHIFAGEEFTLLQNGYSHIVLPPIDSVINDIYMYHPEITILSLKVEAAKLETNRNKQNYLPELQAGYESEEILGDKYAGFKAGISIPLWRDKNKLKHAKALSIYSVSQFESRKAILIEQLKSDYYQTYELGKLRNEYSETISETEMVSFLNQSFELNNITILEYFVELNNYYQVKESYLKLDNDYHKQIIKTIWYSDARKWFGEFISL